MIQCYDGDGVVNLQRLKPESIGKLRVGDTLWSHKREIRCPVTNGYNDHIKRAVVIEIPGRGLWPIYSADMPQYSLIL